MRKKLMNIFRELQPQPQPIQLTQESELNVLPEYRILNYVDMAAYQPYNKVGKSIVVTSELFFNVFFFISAN
jgi:hypothetical protein